MGTDNIFTLITSCTHEKCNGLMKIHVFSFGKNVPSQSVHSEIERDLMKENKKKKKNYNILPAHETQVYYICVNKRNAICQEKLKRLVNNAIAKP